MKLAWMLLVAVHHAVVIGNAASFFILPLCCPWYQSLPLCSMIFFLTFAPVECPLTKWENKLREKLGWKRIGGFVGHYYVKPVKMVWFGSRFC